MTVETKRTHERRAMKTLEVVIINHKPGLFIPSYRLNTIGAVTLSQPPVIKRLKN
jgi:hypothetical protein